MRYIIILFMFMGCTQKRQAPFTAGHISQVITNMTDVMIHDITNPPLAARFFAYACLAGQEVISQNDSSIQTMHGRLNDYPALQKPNANYHVQLSALLAMLYTAQKLQPSGLLLKQHEKQLLDVCDLPREQIKNSIRYAESVSNAILAYARSDHYNRISNYPRYTPIGGAGNWYPTAPAYMAAVEPYFSTVRPFALDSCSQFRAPRPVSYSTLKSSRFYTLMQQNYTAANQLSYEQKAIAAFWDCNPFAVTNDGHLVLSQKKISPGAHWLGITGIACVQARKNFAASMQVFTSVAIGLMDAFICCWQEKYESNRIRPETAIRRSIDLHWQPLLQTPPFPEYLSGHSVISSASATILSHYFGDSFSYTDSVEVAYGLPPRRFSSFQHAAEEAAISRFYGGIHFMDAIENGLVVGKQVGEQVILRIKGS